MIITELVEEGLRKYTFSDSGLKILQVETGLIYDDAIDVLPYHYEETNTPIADPAEEADE